MSEPAAVYVVDTSGGVMAVAAEGNGGASLDMPPGLRLYFERRRDALISELRELDRVLGRPQTVPERRRR